LPLKLIGRFVTTAGHPLLRHDPWF